MSTFIVSHNVNGNINDISPSLPRKLKPNDFLNKLATSHQKSWCVTYDYLERVFGLYIEEKKEVWTRYEFNLLDTLDMSQATYKRFMADLQILLTTSPDELCSTTECSSIKTTS